MPAKPKQVTVTFYGDNYVESETPITFNVVSASAGESWLYDVYGAGTERLRPGQRGQHRRKRHGTCATTTSASLSAAGTPTVGTPTATTPTCRPTPMRATR
jgi:hypothetical protein